MNFIIHSPKYGDKEVLIDDEDWLLLKNYKFYVIKDHSSNRFYCRMYIKGTPIKQQKTLTLHKFLMNPPKGMMIDHINGDGLDNRRYNLRICTNAENQYNSKKHIDNTSGYKGVNWDKQRKKYRAKILINKKRLHLGYFDDSIDAHKAYCEASKKYHGKFGRAI